jgi:hypothetical protein
MLRLPTASAPPQAAGRTTIRHPGRPMPLAPPGHAQLPPHLLLPPRRFAQRLRSYGAARSTNGTSPAQAAAHGQQRG